MLSNEFITGMFQWLNFAALVGALVYIYKRYLSASIQEQKENKQAVFVDLQAEQHTLVQVVQELETIAREDKQLCDNYKKRVIQWRRQVEQDVRAHNKKREVHAEHMKTRVRKQMHALEEQIIKEQAVPQALAEAREALKEKFVQKQAGDAFNEALLAFMRERSS